MKFSRILLWIFTVVVAVWMVAPSLVVIPLSFTSQKSLAFPPVGFSGQWYENFFTDPAWLGGLANSLQLGLMVAVVATILGTVAAYGLMKMSGFAKAASNNFLLLPMLVPGVIFAIGVYALFLRLGLVGTWPGFLLAHTVLAIPFVVISVSSVLASYDVQLERAAWISGAGKVKAFLTVTLPMIRPGVLAGFLFAFITSFDEVIVSLFISNAYLQTLPVRMFSSLQREIDPTIAAAATIIMLITTSVALFAMIARAKRSTSHD
ncbi:ABC transporter permease [Cryobacterium sp. TMT1-3]|uniref:ABC transporter permease n=1 Tax=Cryobacterium sp. TMT1-3 TaxID=1259237 RepID=UPI00106D4782|nr:ABC transporter permease [Cryobacterium sp. TMT1-3]TFC28590.1 ABC transporter permease [Cryobacterium sp. TMT1-3]